MARDMDNFPMGFALNYRFVCKHYLVDFCPNELFVNTRSDLGQCEKIHDDHLKKDYKESSRFKRMNYEEEFLQYLQQIMNDVEKRIKRGHSRLALNSNRANLTAPNRGPDEEQIKILSERITSLLEQVESLGCEGRVDEAQNVMKLCDKLTMERAELQAASEEVLDTILSQEKQMEVCEVCGAFLIVGDSQTRVDDHLMGKQHMGFAKIKLTIEEIRDKRHKLITDREDKIRKEREEREKEREKEREERRKREREGKREREREREERRKEREKRERERSRRRSRSRSRDRRRRSRSRDRRRSRSRDRRRSRSRDRTRDRRRSRSSEHRHRSRSRDRRRSRSKERRRDKSRSRSRERRHSRRGSREKSSRSEERGDSRKGSRDRSRSKSPAKDTKDEENMDQAPQENQEDQKIGEEDSSKAEESMDTVDRDQATTDDGEMGEGEKKVSVNGSDEPQVQMPAF
nr:LOW QUALITY PROTEIN: luc7-like protein 3 [Lytechinus pictus]